MKSDVLKLELRGYIADGAEFNYQNIKFSQKTAMLKSEIPTERTIAARLLAKDKTIDAVNTLITALQQEKKLYTKTEICNSLIEIGTIAIEPLIDQLGQIGNNQIKKLPDKTFNKKSYPLPRDIAARTLIRFKHAALKLLLAKLDELNPEQISEALDVMGFIRFYNYSKDVYPALVECYKKYHTNNLIVFKLVRAMSACPEAQSFLTELSQKQLPKRICQEIDRSLFLTSLGLT